MSAPLNTQTATPDLSQSWFSFSHMSRELTGRFLPHAKRRGVTLDFNVDRGLFIWGPRRWLFGAIGQLLADLIRSFDTGHQPKRIYLNAFIVRSQLRFEMLASGPTVRGVAPEHIARIGSLLNNLYGADLSIGAPRRVAKGVDGNRISIAFGRFLHRPPKEPLGKGCSLCLLPVSTERAWLYWQIEPKLLRSHPDLSIRLWPEWQPLLTRVAAEGSHPLCITQRKQRAFLGLEGSDTFIELARSNPVGPIIQGDDPSRWLERGVSTAMEHAAKHLTLQKRIAQ